MSRQKRSHAAHMRRRHPHQVIIARGDDVRCFTVRGWMIALGVIFAVGITFWLFAATAYVVFRDDVLAGMMARQTKMQHAYEDRIATLRLQIDRVTSRQLLDQDAFNARVDDLVKRQTSLDQRARTLGAIVDGARQSGVSSNILPDPETTGSLPRRAEASPAQIETLLGGVEQHLSGFQQHADVMLEQIESKARQMETDMRSALTGIGVDPDKLAGPRPRFSTSGGPVGGPLVPLSGRMPIDAFDLRAARTNEVLGYITRVKNGLGTMPLRKPVDSDIDMTSNFGVRIDPFLGIPAFHAGVDFRAEIGEPVRATASGTITTAGRNGGYGNLVEVSHGNSLSTRYGHLSQILVHEGQSVSAGQVIGRSGSTGRSTGPHVHYETRINGEAINPERFIRASQKLGMW